MVFIVMGVSGCGKSTIGGRLAAQLNMPFYDGDDFHPQANKEKMAKGQPLTSEDRFPWLIRLAKVIRTWNEEGGAVLACSALKRDHRRRLRLGGDVRFIHLKGSKQTLLQRLACREGHFMPAALLQSQLDTLEEPRNSIEIDINQTIEKMIHSIMQKIASQRA